MLVIFGTGLVLPLTVPRVWGKYPDGIERDERIAAEEAVRKAALRRAGKFQRNHIH